MNTNPLLPSGYDIVWSIAVVLPCVLFVAAIATLVGARDRMAPLHLMIWTATIVVAPVVGALAWLLVGLPLSRRGARASGA